MEDKQLDALLLNQLATINAIYRTLEAERTRQIEFCISAGINRSEIFDVIGRNERRQL